jgi:hypothetical protein
MLLDRIEFRSTWLLARDAELTIGDAVSLSLALPLEVESLLALRFGPGVQNAECTQHVP